MKFRVASLFAGVGGICLGFKNANYKGSSFELIWANEIDEYACKTYSENFDHNLIQGDIEKLLNPSLESNSELQEVYVKNKEFILNQKIDVLTAGFPCQSFSIAGYRKGFSDSRGNLFWSIVDMINLLDKKNSKPKVILLENVKNLKSHNDGKTYETIKNELQILGYHIKDAVLNTKDFSTLPQNRERIYIVGFLNPEYANEFNLFDQNIQENLKKNISQKERKTYISKILDLNITPAQKEDLFYTKEKYPKYFSESSNGINLDKEITEEFEFYQVRRGMYVRKNQSGVCPTLTANMGTGGHNVPIIKTKHGIRKLSPSETFKLQGFPVDENYRLSKVSNGRLYKQAGNAVSVDIITLIANEILKILQKAD